MNPTDIIRDPGKFEGEPEYVRELWESVMDGGSDETLYDGETPCDVFYLNPDMRTRYALDAGDYAIIVWESDQGFVNSRVLTETEYTAFEADCQADSDESEGE